MRSAAVDRRLEAIAGPPLAQRSTPGTTVAVLDPMQDRTIYDILAEQKPNQQEQYRFKREDIRKYFPKSYTDKQVCDTVIKLLEQWQRRRERDRDSR